MAAEKARWMAFALALLLSGCVAAKDSGIRKLALLAPFEGEYRAVGYNALYAVRMALRDSGGGEWQLLAVDDGGSPASARDRMRALNLDPAVKAILALGGNAAHPTAQMANDKPLLFIGNWGYRMRDSDSLCLCDRALAEAADDRLMAQLVAGGLVRPPVMRSSGSMPDPSFAARYAKSDRHAPKANWLASLTYDAARMLLEALNDGIEIAEASYAGMNGRIAFRDGYWIDAPIHRYQFSYGEMIALED